MPCYSITPASRRSIHYNPFFGFQSLAPSPRFSSPLFRSFEEGYTQLDNFFREVDQQVAKAQVQSQSVQPRFDIKEESNKFVLHGELPGVQPENLQIEFVDRNTMVVKGKIVRQENHGTPPVAPTAPATNNQQLEGDKSQEDVTMSGALPQSEPETPSSTVNYHRASVEDEDAVENDSTTSETNNQPAASTAVAEDTTVSRTQPQQETIQAQQPEQAQSHYWVSERIVGEFSRAFRFPGRVNQDGVKASLKDGILTVDVPKAQEQSQRRRIEIQGV